jgi:hypothetical protein
VSTRDRQNVCVLRPVEATTVCICLGCCWSVGTYPRVYTTSQPGNHQHCHIHRRDSPKCQVHEVYFWYFTPQ